MLGFAKNIGDNVIAELYGMTAESYRSIRDRLEQQGRDAALHLLADAAFADRVDHLPFRQGETVIGIGESTTDDLLSWFEILRHLLQLRRPQDGIRLLNEGVSGHTSSQVLGRMIGIVNQKPDWIICMIGGNDVLRIGPEPAKPQVSLEETTINLKRIRTIASTRTAARWVWMTPPTIDEQRAGNNPYFRQGELVWRNEDIVAIGDFMRQQPDAIVDTQNDFGASASSEWLEQDGVHPSLEGQKAIVKRLVEELTGGISR
jgi:lysophospholipase L1-like esterase